MLLEGIEMSLAIRAEEMLLVADLCPADSAGFCVSDLNEAVISIVKGFVNEFRDNVRLAKPFGLPAEFTWSRLSLPLLHSAIVGLD